MFGQKINEQGLYQPFCGVTVVAMLEKQNPVISSLLTQISENEELRKFASPLPLDSMHMTVCDVFCDANVADSREMCNLILSFSPNFPLIKETLQYQDPIKVKVTQLAVKHNISLRLEIAKEDQMRIVTFRNRMRSIGIDVPAYNPHVTLAYFFAPLTLQGQEILQEIVNQYQDIEILLEPSQLVYFSSMEAYHPL